MDDTVKTLSKNDKCLSLFNWELKINNFAINFLIVNYYFLKNKFYYFLTINYLRIQ